MAEDIKTQDITKATEALLTDLLLATTQPTTGNPENKNISIELLKKFINKEVEESIKKLQETDNTLITKTKGLVDIQIGKEDLAFEENVKTERVNFSREMLGKKTPAIFLTIGGGSGWTKRLHVTATTSDNNGFDLNYGSDSGSGTVAVAWVALGRD